jgi:hypothetical protein
MVGPYYSRHDAWSIKLMANLETRIYILDCRALTVSTAVLEFHMRICVIIKCESVLMLASAVESVKTRSLPEGVASRLEKLNSKPLVTELVLWLERDSRQHYRIDWGLQCSWARVAVKRLHVFEPLGLCYGVIEYTQIRNMIVEQIGLAFRLWTATKCCGNNGR